LEEAQYPLFLPFFHHLSLSLFMFGVGTNHPDGTLALDDPAVPTYLFD